MRYLQLKEISKSYGHRKILDSTSMDVKQGEIVLIEGQSGMGKTTLLNITAGIDSPDSGTVIIENIDIFSLNENKRAKFRLKKMGVIFQQMNLIDDLNVMENIALPLKLAGRKWKDRVEELLHYLKIETLRYEMPSSISGGELQRCAIARALANEPDIIIADELTSNLDNDNSKNIGDLLKRINHEMGTTIIIATHDPRIGYIATRQFVLEEGKLYER